MFSWNKSHHLKTGKCWFRGEFPRYSLIKTWSSIAHNGKVGNKYYIKLSDVDLFSEKAMPTHSSTLAWKIPWTEEPGGLQSMGSRRVGHNWVTSLSLFTFMHWRRKWQPTPAFLPGESQGWWSLVGCRLWGRTESDTTEVTAAAAAFQIFDISIKTNVCTDDSNLLLKQHIMNIQQIPSIMLVTFQGIKYWALALCQLLERACYCRKRWGFRKR